MPKRTRDKAQGRPERGRSSRFLEELDDGMARDILLELCREKPAIAKRVETAMRDRLADTDVDDTAVSVFEDLDDLKVEEVWDNSGRTRHGYVEPVDYAFEMTEEAIEPYLDEMRRCQRLGMRTQARDCCLGILKGLYRYETEGSNEFADWAADAPESLAHSVFKEWCEGTKGLKARKDLLALIRREIPKVVDWISSP